ncbi:MAG: DUF3426 domain-containing protein [Steroidobacteraceae bacterium]
MFTVCPKCALTLVVTAADLRIAQGYVRCGRCLNVFNALARLSEERSGAAPLPPLPPPEDAGTAASAATAEEPERDAPVQPSAPSTQDDIGEIEIELDPSILVTSVRAPTPPSETAEDAAGADESEPQAASAEPMEAQAPSTDVTRAPAAHAAREPVPVSAASSSPTDTPQAPQTNSELQPPDEAFTLVTRSRASRAWKLGAGVLAIALAAQIVNHYRDALAANPTLEGPLRTVYSVLGVQLAPRWNVHAYEVRQLGASVAGTTPGEIVVRASVKNGASRPQPLPLLRVILQDRFGNRIAARDVPPRDYLPSSAAPISLLAAGSRVDATLVFVDPGPQAVGFEIDACLAVPGAHAPAQTGHDQTVACAHGP